MMLPIHLQSWETNQLQAFFLVTFSRALGTKVPGKRSPWKLPAIYRQFRFASLSVALDWWPCQRLPNVFAQFYELFCPWVSDREEFIHEVFQSSWRMRFLLSFMIFACAKSERGTKQHPISKSTQNRNTCKTKMENNEKRCTIRTRKLRMVTPKYWKMLSASFFKQVQQGMKHLWK